MRIAPLSIAAMILLSGCGGLSRLVRREREFSGRYGYRIAVPDSYDVKTFFEGEIETTELSPKACAGRPLRECDLMGQVELSVIPKRAVARDEHAADFAAYTADVLKEAGKFGLQTLVTRGERAGFPSAAVVMPGHPRMLNAMILVEGSLVYYRFKYHHPEQEKAAAAFADSIREVAPSDVIESPHS